MKNSSFTLFIEINKHSFVFFTCKNVEQNDFKIIYRLETTLKGVENNKISDLEAVLDVIKNNVYIAEIPPVIWRIFNESNPLALRVTLVLDNDLNPFDLVACSQCADHRSCLRYCILHVMILLSTFNFNTRYRLTGKCQRHNHAVQYPRNLHQCVQSDNVQHPRPTLQLRRSPCGS